MVHNIASPRLLVVEGKDEEKFFTGLFNSMSLANVQVIPIDGKDKLRSKIEAIRNLPDFETVERLGVIRDALYAVGLPRPRKIGLPFGKNPRVGVYILPGRGRKGMLEDLCFDSIAGRPEATCVIELLKCLRRKRVRQPSPIAKARLHAYLASQPKPGLRLGEAAEKGYWPFEDPSFNGVRKFLSTLFP